MESLTGKNVKSVMLNCIEKDAVINTDESPSDSSVQKEFAEHQAVNQNKGEDVRENSKVNRVESVHALWKRGIVGTFHHVSKRHLHRYLNEFDFRFNHRKIKDGERTLNPDYALENTNGYSKTLA